MKFRIAAVSFLNTVPLIDWFSTGKSPEVELIRALPSHLAPLLDAGEADVALLPVVELFRGHSAGIIPGTGIGCSGPVDSVKLFYQGKLADLKMIRADRGSRTSVALLRVLMAEQFSERPVFAEFEPEVGACPTGNEGHLVIGDRCFEYEEALRDNHDLACRTWDLGEAWHDLTGLPFVFAIWCASTDLPERVGTAGIAELTALLNRAREYGVSNIETIATREANSGRKGHAGGADRDAMLYYFQKSLRYEMGDQEMAGLHQFLRLCIKHGVVPAGAAPVIL